MGVINGNGSWEYVLQYIYKHKRRHFKKERYKWFFESEKKESSKMIEEQKEEGSKLVEEEKEGSVFDQDKVMNANTDKDEELGSSKKIDTEVNKLDSSKVLPATKTSIDAKGTSPVIIYVANKIGAKSKKKKAPKPQDEDILCTICQLDFEEGELVCELD